MRSAAWLAEAISALHERERRKTQLQRTPNPGGLPAATGVGAWDEARARAAGGGGLAFPITEENIETGEPQYMETTDGLFTLGIKPITRSRWVDGEGNAGFVAWYQGEE